jgi:hypothetical protein
MSATRKVAIMQPTYLPYLGYLDLIQRAHIFVFLDDCQFDRRSWQQRNRILARHGEEMLSVPVKKRPVETEIREMEIDESQPWRRDHFVAIRRAYLGRPGFEDGWAFIQAGLKPKPGGKLADVTIGLIETAADKLGFTAERVRSSALLCGGQRSEHSLAILRKLGADLYLSPSGSREYIEADGVLATAGVPVRYLSYAPIAYPQGRDGFTPYMGFIDALMNLGWAGLAAHMAEISKQAFVV